MAPGRDRPRWGAAGVSSARLDSGRGRSGFGAVFQFSQCVAPLVSTLSAETLLAIAIELELAPQASLGEVFERSGGSGASVAEFGQQLVRQELLTSFQLERLLAGNRTGFYYGPARLLYQVGAGSFARVYRAIHRDSGEIKAVKVLRRRHADDVAKRAAFQREGEMGRLLRHKNIVAIEDVGEQSGQSYITMEFVEGQTLRELARRRGGLDLPVALDLLLQMLCGLDYAHRRGLAHRDLKPSNVLVSATGAAKLVDFGLAQVDATGDKALGSAAQPRTLDYAALEKLTGVKHDDLRSDIYFMGALGYFALAGRSALKETRDRNERADPRRFLEVEPLARIAPGLPREVCDLVARMMHLDPLERWQTAGEIIPVVERLRARPASSSERPAEEPNSATAPSPAGDSRPRVMIVESSQAGQESLREFFQKLGCRVLVTANPRRALSRFSTPPVPADCIVMSTRSLGEEAVEAFNEMAKDPFLAAVPAILLLDPRQEELAGLARFDELRRSAKHPPQAEELVPLLAALVRS